MDSGSVITRDHGIYILCQVSGIKKFHNDCMELLLEQIEKAPVNQVPMYAEKMAEVISSPYIKRLALGLRSRKDVLEIESKKKRIEKLLRSEEHTSELQSPCNLVCRLLLEKKNL